jgi:hypothetical protein
MTHRKNIEHWLEADCNAWDGARLNLILSNNLEYRWHLTVADTEYEIEYNDLGYIALSSLPCSGYMTSEVREIYQGDTSEQSYRSMIGILADNFSNSWI